MNSEISLSCSNCGNSGLKKMQGLTYQCPYCSGILIIPPEKIFNTENTYSNIYKRPTPEVEVIYKNSRDDGIGNTYLYGYVINTCRIPIESICLTIKLILNGREVGLAKGYADKINLLPGEYSTFGILGKQIPKFDDLIINATMRDLDYRTLKRPELCFSGTTMIEGPRKEEFHIKGYLKNFSISEIDFLQIFVTVKNIDTKILTIGSVIVKNLATNENRQFDCAVYIFQDTPVTYALDICANIWEEIIQE